MRRKWCKRRYNESSFYVQHVKECIHKHALCGLKAFTGCLDATRCISGGFTAGQVVKVMQHQWRSRKLDAVGVSGHGTYWGSVFRQSKPHSSRRIFPSLMERMTVEGDTHVLQWQYSLVTLANLLLCHSSKVLEFLSSSLLDTNRWVGQNILNRLFKSRWDV